MKTNAYQTHILLSLLLRGVHAIYAGFVAPFFLYFKFRVIKRFRNLFTFYSPCLFWYSLLRLRLGKITPLLVQSRGDIIPCIKVAHKSECAKHWGRGRHSFDLWGISSLVKLWISVKLFEAVEGTFRKFQWFLRKSRHTETTSQWNKNIHDLRLKT